MNLLVTDPGIGVWEMPPNDAQPRKWPCAFPWPCMPCVCPGCAAVCCAQTRECLCLERRGQRIISAMPAAPGVSDMCLSPCGRYLYQLSGEADCIHLRSVATGELLYAAPAGVFPRMMRLDAAGKTLLYAGGAVNEACLLDASSLVCEKTITTKHACFGADFWRGGLVLVCAAEGDDIQTAVCTLSPHGVKPRTLTVLPGQPGALCVCPDGATALLSTRDGLMKLDLNSGELLWNQPEWALCMRLCCRGGWALVSAALDGRVCLINHHRPWERRVVFSGTEAQACFLT